MSIDADHPRTDDTAVQGPRPAPPGQPARRGRWLVYWGPPAAVFAAMIAIWYGVSYLLLDPDRRFLVPPPHAVIQVAFLDPDNLQELLAALWLSTKVAFIGLAVAILVGVLLAVAMSQARWIERSLYPYAVLTETVPVLAMVPLFGFWFGFGNFSRVLVVVIFCIFPIIANTLFGRPGAPRPVHPAPGRAPDPAVEAAAPGRPTVDLHRPADRRRPGRDRGDRR